jgi:SPP1 family predicted phage head-tail adaptor
MLNSKEQIGRLDRRITFQEKIVGENESNEDAETGWEDIETRPTVWASKSEKSVGSGEQYRADKLTDFKSVVFVCRYRSDITAKHRIICDGVKYSIISPPQEISRRRYLTIETESGGEFVENAPEFTEEFSEEFNS